MEYTSLKFGKENFVGKASGTLLDYYEVIKQLGKGGYGKVYEVKNIKTGAIRACKHVTKLKIKNLEKFQREINILVKADHPNIIKLYEVYESDRSLYLVMEECQGGEVFDRIIERIKQKKMYTEKDAAYLFSKMMSAIEYCHSLGICHRDLKLENLLYVNPIKDENSDINNPIKVIDFGLSQYFGADRKLKTKVGTAYYVSPELLKGNYTEKCDIWSAGVILYMILLGEPPFNGPDDSAIYDKILHQKLQFPEKKWANISNEAKDLIQHMIAPEKDRYSAKQVLEHPWLKKVDSIPLVNLNFNILQFKEYFDTSMFKKVSLLFIASRLNESDIKHLNEIFKAFDKENDGQISYEELRQGLDKLSNGKITDNEVDMLFKKIDIDKNGKIGYTEFLASVLEKQIYLKSERLYETFCEFDKDGCGKITKEDLIEKLKLEEFQEKDVEKLIDEVDTNKDGVIDYKEFLNLMGYENIQN